MEYAQARNIRGSKLSNLITDKIVSGSSVTGAVRGAISEKIRAKATGIKEKFDPLNIAKFVTGGSRLAPAILGRLTGRSDKDIRYFAGSKTSLKSRSTKIDRMPERPAGSSEVAENLSKIYNLLARSRENDMRMRAIERSFMEEKRNEDERRHQEFMRALSDFTGAKPKAVLISPKTEGEGLGLFDSLVKMISDLQNRITKLVNDITDLKKLSNLAKPGASLASKLGKAAAAVGGALAAGAEKAAGLLARVPGGPATLFLLPYAMTAYEKEKIRENPNAPEYKDNPYAMVLRGEAKTEEEAANINRRKALKSSIRRNEIEQAVNSSLDDRTLLEEYGATRDQLKQWLSDKNNKLFNGAKPVETPNTLQRLGVESSTAGAGRGNAQLIDYLARMDEERTGGRASFGVRPMGIKSAPVQPSPPPVAQLTDMNRDLEMSYDLMGNAIGPTVINNQSQSSTKEKPMPVSPSVRDDTPILKRVFGK